MRLFEEENHHALTMGKSSKSTISTGPFSIAIYVSLQHMGVSVKTLGLNQQEALRRRIHQQGGGFINGVEDDIIWQHRTNTGLKPLEKNCKC